LLTKRILTNLSAAAGAAVTLGTAVAAEPINIKPGLWDVTQTMTMSGAPLYVEGMNAAQRAEYAKSWAKTANKPETETDKQCITAKEIRDARLFEDKSSEGKQCTRTVKSQTSTAWRASSECKDEKTTNLLELDYAAPAPDRFTGAVKSTMTSPNGKTVIDIRLSGKWVGASCPDEEAEESDASAESED
jgi:hypothetical protein